MHARVANDDPTTPVASHGEEEADDEDIGRGPFVSGRLAISEQSQTELDHISVLCSACRCIQPDGPRVDPGEIVICRCCEEPCQSLVCVNRRPPEVKQPTAALDAELQAIRDRWLAHGLSTEPADRASAEAGVHLTYEAAGLKPPSTVIWAGSPLSGALVAAMVRKVRYPQRLEIESHIVWEFKHKMHVPFSGAIEDRDHRISNRVSSVRHRVRKQLVGQLRPSQVEWYLGDRPFQEENVLYGQHAADQLAEFECRAAVGAEGIEKLDGLMLVARSAGWWWPFVGVAVITDRPELLRRDGQGRPHALNGPAIRYRDGWAIWAWHGALVARQTIEAPETITVKQIDDEMNGDIRKALIDRFGTERYLKDRRERVRRVRAMFES